MWANDFEFVLESIRENCLILKKRHTKNYFRYKDTLKYYKIPVILISALNSVASVGLEKYMAQRYISGGTCLLSLIVGVIGSIQLFLKIEENMESSLIASKDYYQLATDIYATLSLQREHRTKSGKEAFDEYYSKYMAITEKATLINKKYNDSLFGIPRLPNNNELRLDISPNLNDSSSDDTP